MDMAYKPFHILCYSCVLVPQANNVPTNRSFNIYFLWQSSFGYNSQHAAETNLKINDYMFVWDLSLVDFVF